MKKDNQNQAIAHFAWCALIALHIARKEGEIDHPHSEHFFLLEWLGKALKQHTFNKCTEAEIRWLLNQALMFGEQFDLLSKLNLLWNTSSGAIKDESDLIHLTQAVDKIKTASWDYGLLTADEWNLNIRSRAEYHKNALLLLRSSLDKAFDQTGKQTEAIMAIASGQIKRLKDILEAFGWTYVKVDNTNIIKISAQVQQTMSFSNHLLKKWAVSC
ncbi:DUF2913 family protein [Pantoea sp. LMR881]|uniref:DUF2913 family protein n=1 Tax=Pantoea sp. LMR881 TaxID=3014336 RepID=UPI0022AF4903|nr:DUF2913 family protein [Pantoea sp. LMR881]MCZ4061044.1 DUF2913 family protein [Pantoea sp. LMR881]